MRPLYHFTPPQNFMNDPNGLVYLAGAYHLFYQHNPYGDTWGHMSWGHAISRDGLHWEHWPIALYEEDDIMIFSGSAVVDWNDSGGFGTAPTTLDNAIQGAGNPSLAAEEKPRGIYPLVAIYTGHGKGLETQNIAYSLDGGHSWTKYPGNPVIDIGSDNFRDPKVFWHAASQRWIMVVALPVEHQVCLYASTNLKTWLPLSRFGPAGLTDQVWECPDLFALPIEGEDAHAWVLKVDSGPSWYIVGDFDGVHFTPSQHPQRMDYGPDFYACQSWNNLPPGQHRLLGWMVHWPYANQLPTSPWRGVMTIPRELTLRRRGAEWHLVQRPIGLEEMRETALREKGNLSGERLLPIRGDAVEIQAEFHLASATEVGIGVRLGKGQETRLGYDATRGELFVDRSRAGRSDFGEGFAARHAAPLTLEGGCLRLHLLVDRCSVEVFANDGEHVITSLIFPDDDSQGIALYASGGEAYAEVTVWRLQ